MKKDYSVRLAIISNFSRDHILSAIHLAKLAYDKECEFNKSNKDSIPFISHRSYVTGSLLMCVAFLEARINELIAGAALGVNPWNAESINQRQYQGFQKTAAVEGIRYLKTLEKYQLVLSYFNQEIFSTEKTPYQDISLLISLRNKLIHFEPEALFVEPENEKEVHSLIKKLRAKKALNNPIALYMKQSNSLDIILGYATTKWAIKSSIKFVTEFDVRIDLIPNYKDLENKLP